MINLTDKKNNKINRILDNLDKEMTNIMNEFSSKTTFMPNNKESIELRSKIEDIKKKYESLRDMLT
jgi:archaellum component FlaC